jgi:hypothetical protein
MRSYRSGALVFDVGGGRIVPLSFYVSETLPQRGSHELPGVRAEDETVRRIA